MSQTELGEAAVADILHYGVKGMKWGKRKKDTTPAGKVRVDVTSKGKLSPSGGRGFKPKEEAIQKVAVQQVARKSGVHTLSNKQLQDAVTRMNLEQQFVRLSPQTKKQKTAKFVSEMLIGVGKQQASRVANDVAGQQVGNLLAKTKK